MILGFVEVSRRFWREQEECDRWDSNGRDDVRIGCKNVSFDAIGIDGESLASSVEWQ